MASTVLPIFCMGCSDYIKKDESFVGATIGSMEDGTANIEYYHQKCFKVEGNSNPLSKAKWSEVQIMEPVDSGKKSSNPKDRAATNRLDLSLAPATARAYLALGCVEGDCKYGGFNYRVDGILASTYYSAANRHLDKWFNGEWADPETGVPHLASALASIGILVDGVETNKLVDDRPPVCDMTKLFKEMEDRVTNLHRKFPNGVPRFTELGVARRESEIST